MTTLSESNAATEILVQRLLAIRERLFRLASMFAVTLSWDVAHEADRWRAHFWEVAETLHKVDAGALDRITAGHEGFLSAEPMRKPTVPLATQQLFELAADVRSERTKPLQPQPPGYVPDGLQRFV